MRAQLLVTIGIAASSVHAATLDSFTDFVGSPTQLAYFADTWTSDPDLQTPRVSFTQESGFYSFSGGTNSSDSFVDKYLNDEFTNISFGNINTLTLTAKILANNAAASFVIILNDGTGREAVASFLTSQFNSSTFTTQSVQLLSNNGFNFTTASVQYYRITGDIPGGTQQLNIAMDNIDVSFQAIPEPATFATLFGLGAVGYVGLRRRPRKIAA